MTGTNPVSTADSNPTTRIEARFGPGQWTREGDDIIISHVLKQVSGDEYIRVRGTNTAELEPQPDAQGESPWSDLWFYSNPIFLAPAPRR